MKKKIMNLFILRLYWFFLILIKYLSKNKIPIILIKRSGKKGPVTRLGIIIISKKDDIKFMLISFVSYIYILN